MLFLVWVGLFVLGQVRTC